MQVKNAMLLVHFKLTQIQSFELSQVSKSAGFGMGAMEKSSIPLDAEWTDICAIAVCIASKCLECTTIHLHPNSENR